MRKSRGAKPQKKSAVKVLKQIRKERAALVRERKRLKAREKVPTTAKEIAQAFRKQRLTKREILQRKKALSARDSYKPRKKDRGKVVLVGVSGQRDPQAHGKKGYAVYVTKTGKKRLLIAKGTRDAYRPKKIKEVELPALKNLKRAVGAFQKAKLEMISTGKDVVKGSGKITTGGAWDFNKRTVEKIAKSIKRALDRQASKRSFLIEVMVFVRLPDGTTKVYEFAVPIDRPDHIAIRLGGIINFVSRKFYAFMARELAYDGYVSSGSYNHIRNLKVNAFISKDDWLNNNDEKWAGIDKEVVHIEAIEWKIKQVK